ncbi:MAG: AAA family ATPase [Armatimonadota bacterium]|nr:MAG: AAA family ATPase [Armatimonadota bacterium]
MSVKIAVAGKGGVGKTTLSAALVRALAGIGERVLAVDADPNNCLGRALAFPEEALESITPLSEMKEMLAERAGKAEGGGFFALNPPIEDLLDEYRIQREGISLLVMGTVDEPGAGCVCPESAVLKALVRHLVSLEDLSLVMDMEAGLEHLGRGTARDVGALLIVTEPTVSSARTAARVARLAEGLGLRLPGVVVNKAASPEAKAKVEQYLDGLNVFAVLPADEAVAVSEVVPAEGPYVAAVEELRVRLSQWLAAEEG